MVNERDSYSPTDLPPRGARILAFAAVLVAALCGGLIGWVVTDLQVEGNDDVASGIGALFGVVIAGGGVAVVAVLVLRAMAEWRTQNPPG